MTKTEFECERMLKRVNVAANALLEIRQIIGKSADPAIYSELACELRIAGVAISRMDEMLYQGRT